MSLQRRTLCFVLLLFLENDLRIVAGVSVETITTEYINSPQGPLVPPNSVLSISSTNRFPPEPPAPKVYSYGPYPPPNVRPYDYPSYTTTTVEISNPLTKPDPRTETVKVIEKIESPPQPPTPRFPPFPPKPSNPPTTIQETLQTKYFPDRYPQTIETTDVIIPSNEDGSKPLILQINVPAPEPVAAVLPQPASVPTYDYSPRGMPPSPVIVMEKSKSSMKSILPILILSLLDGGRGNNGCCCCQKSTNIPVPYPIAYPIYNPVVSTRGKGKGKKPAKDEDDDDKDDK